MSIKIPRIVIAGTASGVGKTTVSISIMAALSQMGMKVQPFKVGPDYIDAGFHNIATGRQSRNLDGHLIDENSLLEIFDNACHGADIAVIEGVMGLFDGHVGGLGSTAEIARLLRAPVILTIDASGIGQSVAAVAKGYDAHENGIDISGVILNKVGSQRHIEILSSSLKKAGIKTLGAISKDEAVSIKERHLGLTTALEDIDVNGKLEQLSLIASEKMNLSEIENLAKKAGDLSYKKGLFSGDSSTKTVLAVARDKAFSFYYQDNLDILHDLGADLVDFSPIKDNALPVGTDGIYLGGGFPELYSEELSSNKEMMKEIRARATGGMPIYAECGGLVYLSNEIVDKDGNVWPLCGLYSGRAKMNSKLQSLGYKSATTVQDNILAGKGSKIIGHEFHYSSVNGFGKSEKRAYKVAGDIGLEGFITKNTLASYIHLHFASDIKWAKSFIEKSASHRERSI